MSSRYEEISDLLEKTQPPTSASEYEVEWLIESALGVGRDHGEGHAVFVVGPGLTPSLPQVERAARSALWTSTSGAQFQALRLLLPRGQHFRAAAATISVELIRNGIGQRAPQAVFEEVEPFIELVMSRVLLPPEFALGLLGGLIVLRHLLEPLLEIAPQHADDPTFLWQGHEQRSRDFSVGSLGIEVKTTSGPNADHLIGSPRQVEPQSSGGGESALFLASVGLKPSAVPGALSIAAMTDQILTMIGPSSGPRSTAQDTFLSRLASFGPAHCVGYDHDAMQDLEPYAANHDLTYAPRVYDVSDENLKLLRRSALESLDVHPDSVSYVATLPESVPDSPNNPLELGVAICRELLVRHGDLS